MKTTMTVSTIDNAPSKITTKRNLMSLPIGPSCKSGGSTEDVSQSPTVAEGNAAMIRTYIMSGTHTT